MGLCMLLGNALGLQYTIFMRAVDWVLPKGWVYACCRLGAAKRMGLCKLEEKCAWAACPAAHHFCACCRLGAAKRMGLCMIQPRNCACLAGLRGLSQEHAVVLLA